MTTASVSTAQVTPIKKAYRASIYPAGDLPVSFGERIAQLESLLQIPIWLIVQNGRGDWSDIGQEVYHGFRSSKSEIEEGKPVGILLHSPGGLAEEAYKIMRLFQRRTEDVSVIVPHYAKSAATLMALAGKKIFMGRDAELGPLDVQFWDTDKEGWESALNSVQSLERLNVYAIRMLDEAMSLMLLRTRKKPEVLLPHAIDYAAKLISPLSSKIDTLDLTKKSRELKVAEEYALRLMKAHYSRAIAERIAKDLVSNYPTHGFVIGRVESSVFESPAKGKPFGLGLKIEDTPKEVEVVFDELTAQLESLTVIGRVKEVVP
jgi:hypothetical protein